MPGLFISLPPAGCVKTSSFLAQVLSENSRRYETLEQDVGFLSRQQSLAKWLRQRGQTRSSADSGLCRSNADESSTEDGGSAPSASHGAW